jgi:hypothetical protein
MTTILTPTEAATVLRCDPADPKLEILLPQVDQFIKFGTGRDWTADDPISPNAKAAARILLVRVFEDPGAIVATPSALVYGLDAVLLQLEVEAIKKLEETAA